MRHAKALRRICLGFLTRRTGYVALNMAQRLTKWYGRVLKFQKSTVYQMLLQTANGNQGMVMRIEVDKTLTPSLLPPTRLLLSAILETNSDELIREQKSGGVIFKADEEVLYGNTN